MALDTLALRSPFVSEEIAQAIEKQCILRQGVDLNSGDVIYSITTGSLEGSHDSRISIKVERERWEVPKVKSDLVEWAIPSSEKKSSKKTSSRDWSDVPSVTSKVVSKDGVHTSEVPDFLRNPVIEKWTSEVDSISSARSTRSRSAGSPRSSSTPVRIPCEPFVYIEASVHEALGGHNVCGGPEGFRESAHWLISLVAQLLGVELPDPDIWEVRRIDNANVFQLPSFEACEEYFRGLNAADYPRRSVTRYGNSGIYAQGSTTTLKFYHKGPEFQKHDRKRLVKILSTEKLFELQELAHRTIRVEVEIKARKLEQDFGHSPLVREVTDDYINRVHDTEVQRFLKEGAKEMELVRDAQSVQRRLRQVYDDRLAGLLFGTWYQFTTLGEDFVKKSYAKRTFYRQRKQLVDAGISWHGTDVVLRKHSAVPAGFTPTRQDPRRNIAELIPVALKLAPIRNKLDFLKVGQPLRKAQ